MEVATPEGFEVNPKLVLDFKINEKNNYWKFYLIKHITI
jgi:hypothetical protein